MLDRRTKKQIEWAFRNYDANKAIGTEQEREIAESGITIDFGRIGGSSGSGNPTESKALRLLDKAKQYLWAKVVENTKITFCFEAEEELIKGRYVLQETRTETQLRLGIPDRTYDYWVEKVLLKALQWAFEYNLVPFPPNYCGTNSF